MSTQNKISAVLSAADQQTILNSLASAKQLLPFLINLSKEERKKLHKMGPKSVDYVNLCLQGAQTFPTALTVAFDAPEFQKDVTLVNLLLPIAVMVAALAEGINDTMMAVGSDAMIEADEVYGFLKNAAKKDTNAKTLVDQIAKRYSAQGKKRAKPAAPPTT
jgi:hypothetical protein